MVMVREESLAGVMAEVYGRLTRRPGVMLGQGPWVLGNGLIGTIEAYLSSSPMLLLTDFSDAPHFRCTRPISRPPAIRAAGTRAAPLAASPSRSCRRTTRSPRCRRRSSASSTRWPASRGRWRSSSAMIRWPARSRPNSQPMLYPTRYYLPPPAAAGRAAPGRGRRRGDPRRAKAGHHRRQRRAHRPGL